ncbi:MAG: PAS domain S-box protein [Calditrichaeota bacterium]|nr:PAS domain S-box protein [Calditrichota bacterium]
MKVLIVSENSVVCEKILKELKKSFPEAAFAEVCTEREWNEALGDKTVDALITMENLSWGSGLQLLKQIRQHSSETIAVMVSSKLSLDTAIAGMRLGLSDYITLEDIQRLPLILREKFRKSHNEIQSSRSVNHEYLSDRFYRMLFDNAKDAIFLMDKDVFIDCNCKATEMFGCTRKQILLKKPYEFSPPKQQDGSDSKEKALEKIQAALTGVPQYFEWRYQKLDGSVLDAEISLMPLIIDEKKYIQARVRDISPRKKAEQEFKTLFDNMAIGLYRTTPDGQILMANPTLIKMLGFSSFEELVERNLEEDGFECGYCRGDFKRKINEQGRVSGLISAWKKKDGEVIFVRENAQVVRDENGNILYYEGSAEDITEQIQYEEQIHLLSNALRSVNECISITDENNNFIYVNPAFEKTYGYSLDELIGKNINIVCSEKSPRDIIKKVLSKTLKGEWRGELWNKRKDGSEFLIELQTSVVRDERGNTVALIGVARDITEKKEVERALKESEEKFKILFEFAPDAYYLRDLNGKFIEVNKAAEEMVGYRREELLGKTFFEAGLLSEDQFPIAISALEKGKERKPIGPVEMVLIGKDGSRVPVEIRAIPITINENTIIFGIARDITERKRAEEALKESEAKYRRFFEEDLTGNYISTPDGRLLFCNPAFVRIFGFSSVEDALNYDMEKLYPNPDSRAQLLKKLQKEKKLQNYEIELRRIDGKPLHVIQNMIGDFDENGDLRQIRGYLFDITEQKLLEDELKHAQKMEAIGRLAGGVAHDFNNLLTVINGYSDLILNRIKPTDPIIKEISQIKKAGERASALTNQLLAFSRRQVVLPKIVDLNQIVANTEKMLRRLIGEDIELKTELQQGLGMVKIDPVQIDQIIMNLAVNARDAMPQGGCLIIRTSNVEIKEPLVKSPFKIPPGNYAVLSVCDSGIGMDVETLTHIFEPFFTTKEQGKGTGLGLSMVYGIVKQNKGFIEVKSKPGEGSTFKIYLPRIEEEKAYENKTKNNTEKLSGTETILVIEDEDGVRELVKNALTGNGYNILEACDADEALNLIRKHKPELHLILTDVVMPGMNGVELAKRVKEIHPDIKTLYMSGYTDSTNVNLKTLDDGVYFIQKPFTYLALLRKVRQILNNND